jgi:hypothetical protein
MNISVIQTSWLNCEETAQIRNKRAKQRAHNPHKEMAFTMLKEGISNKVIRLKTGLSSTEVSRHKSELKERGLL